MNWGSPGYLWLGLSVIPVLFALLWGEAARRRELAALVPPEAPPSALRRLKRLALRGAPLLTVFLWVAALAAPQWGVIPETRSSRGGDIVIALDVSKSMLADDLRESRLAAAKKAVAALAGQLQGDRIGLVLFAGSAFVVCPLTNDYSAFTAALAEAGVGTIALGGSSLSAALIEAKRAFSGTKGEGRVLVVVGDGEDHGSDATEALHALAAEGIRLHAVAVGTDAGALIPLPQGGFQKDGSGAVIKSRLNREPLEKIAAAGGGRLVELSRSPAGLVQLYLQDISKQGGRLIESSRHRLRERFQIPLALGLILLLPASLLRRRKSP